MKKVIFTIIIVLSVLLVGIVSAKVSDRTKLSIQYQEFPSR